MKKLTILLFLMVLTFGAVTPIHDAHAASAGTSLDTATNISYGTTYNGTTEKGQNAFYKFTLSSSGKVTLSSIDKSNWSTNNFSYATYYIYDETGTRLWHRDYYSDRTTGQASINEDWHLTKGTYYFVLNSADYKFKLNFETAGESFTETQTIFNNSMEEANTITLNKTYKGQIAINDDIDFYKFTMNSTGKVALSISTKMGSIYYHIYNSSGTEIWWDYINWNTSPIAVKIEDTIALNKGTYYFVAKQCSSYDYGNYSFSISTHPITSVRLNKASATVNKGKTLSLSATITPTNTTDNTNLTWSSSNTNIATVSSKGVVTAKNGGTATITVKTSNGKTATCKITVPYTITYKLNNGKNNSSNPSTYYGKTITLKNPTRKGYIFKGWYTDSKLTKKVTSFSSGNKTVYAKWAKVTVTKAKKPSLTNLKGKKLKISYGATSGAKGYQIQYSTSKSFKTKTTKTVTVKSKTYTLKKGKTYYVRVRAYKLDSTNAKVYGTWSNVSNKKITK